MLNYMKSEWFRTFHRKYLYIMTGCLCALVILASVFLKVNEDVMYDMTDYMGTFLLSIVTTGLSMGYYLAMIVADMMFSDEYKHQTLKNTVSYGISRVKIYLGKLISGLMAGVLVMAVTVAVTVVTALLVFGPDAEFSGHLLNTMLPKLLAFIPLWMGGVAMGTMLLFFFKNTAATFAFLGIAMVLPAIFGYISPLYPIFGEIKNLMVVTKINLVSNASLVSGSLMADCWITGLAAVVMYTVIGALVFSRKEIK